MWNGYLAAGTPDPDWIPDACTLPTVERPVRTSEFDDFFARSVHGVDRPDSRTLRLTFDAAAIDRARDLVARESDCCAFFGFELSPASHGSVSMRVSVPASQAAVLDAFAARAIAAADPRS